MVIHKMHLHFYHLTVPTVKGVLKHCFPEKTVYCILTFCHLNSSDGISHFHWKKIHKLYIFK